jgi:hypothetical protein
MARSYFSCGISMVAASVYSDQPDLEPDGSCTGGSIVHRPVFKDPYPSCRLISSRICNIYYSPSPSSARPGLLQFLHIIMSS